MNGAAATGDASSRRRNLRMMFLAPWFATPRAAARAGRSTAEQAPSTASARRVGSIDGGYRIDCEQAFHLENRPCI